MNYKIKGNNIVVGTKTFFIRKILLQYLFNSIKNSYFCNLKSIFIVMKIRKQTLNEIIDINGSKVFVENGEVKTVLSKTIQKSGYMSVEEARRIGYEMIKNINYYELYPSETSW